MSCRICDDISSLDYCGCQNCPRINQYCTSCHKLDETEWKFKHPSKSISSTPCSLFEPACGSMVSFGNYECPVHFTERMVSEGKWHYATNKLGRQYLAKRPEPEWKAEAFQTIIHIPLSPNSPAFSESDEEKYKNYKRPASPLPTTPETPPKKKIRPSTVDDEGNRFYPIEKLLKWRTSIDGKSKEWYVKWKGYSEAENSWCTQEEMGDCELMIQEYFQQWEIEKKYWPLHCHACGKKLDKLEGVVIDCGEVDCNKCYSKVCDHVIEENHERCLCGINHIQTHRSDDEEEKKDILSPLPNSEWKPTIELIRSSTENDREKLKTPFPVPIAIWRKIFTRPGMYCQHLKTLSCPECPQGIAACLSPIAGSTNLVRLTPLI